MQPIAESELIINDRGAIYHLDVTPDEIAENIITVGDPARVKEVSKYFDKMEVETAAPGICNAYRLGLEKKELSVVSTGIGTG